jgi:hypothetical protein
MKRFLPVFSLFRGVKLGRLLLGNNRRSPVFHQAGCGINALTGHAVIAHDPGYKNMTMKTR